MENMNEKSTAFQFSRADAYRIGRGGLVAIAGALAVFIPQAVGEISWGIWAPFAGAVASILVNSLRIWIADNTLT